MTYAAPSMNPAASAFAHPSQAGGTAVRLRSGRTPSGAVKAASDKYKREFGSGFDKATRDFVAYEIAKSEIASINMIYGAAGAGVKWVEQGALATVETREDDVRRMRRAALYVQRILIGEPAASLPISFEQRPVLVCR